MFKRLTWAFGLSTLIATPALSETIEVQMLNKGTDGERMVFEPAFIRAQPGDTLAFKATDKGHNAETLDGMLPEAATPFAGKINEEITVTLDAAGVYAVICKPHYAMGMVMIVAVGDVAQAPDDFLAGRVPPKAKARFEDQLNNL